MVVSLLFAIIVQLVKIITCGKVSFEDLLDTFENKFFNIVFEMTPNDIEGFRKARGIG